MAFYMGEIKNQRKEFIQAYQDGDYKKAIFLGKRLLDIYEANEDCENMEYAADMSNLALVFDQMRFFEKAEEYYEKAAWLKKQCGGECLSYADTLNNLAIVYNQTGRQEDALRLHSKALEIRDLKLGRDSMDYIHSLYHLGNTYELMENNAKALEMFGKALRRARQCASFSGMDLADIHGALARAYDRQGNFKKAIYFYEICLDLIEKERGSENYYFMLQTLTLATVCEKAGLTDLAVEYCERAIEIRRSLMSEEHLDFINSLNNLAAICCKDKQFEKALRLHREALDLVERMLGRSHIFYADALNNLSVDYCGMKEYKKALALNQKALAQKRLLLGDNDPQTAASLMSMGTLYDDMGKYAEAMECYQQALEIRRKAFSDGDSCCADSLTAIGRLYEHQGAYEAAAAAIQEGLAIRRACGEGESSIYVWSLQLLAEIRRKQGEYAASVALCREGVKITEQRYGAVHPRYASALEKLGLAYEEAEDLGEAAAALELAAKIRKEMLDEDNPQYLGTLEMLARVFTKKREYDRAIALYQEKNDVNFEETPQEQLAAANNLLAVANCYRLAGNEAKAEAYFAEAEGKLKRCGTAPDETYEARRQAYLTARAEKPAARKNTAMFGLSRQQAENAAQMFAKLFEERVRDFGPEDKVALRTALALGDLLNRMGRKEEAVKWFTLAEKEGEGETYIRACRGLGEYWLKKGELEQAFRKLVNAKEYIAEYGDMKSEDYCALLGLLGDYYFQKGEKDRATAFYQPWNKLYKELHLPYNAVYEARAERTARILSELKRHQEAVECYSALALSIRGREGETGNFVRLLMKTASLHAALGNKKDTETLLERALLLGAQDGAATAAYGRLCDRAGRIFATAGCVEKAEETLRMAYRIQGEGERCMTKEGLSALMGILRTKGDKKAYLAVKNGEKLE